MSCLLPLFSPRPLFECTLLINIRSVLLDLSSSEKEKQDEKENSLLTHSFSPPFRDTYARVWVSTDEHRTSPPFRCPSKRRLLTRIEILSRTFPRRRTSNRPTREPRVRRASPMEARARTPSRPARASPWTIVPSTARRWSRATPRRR